MPAKLLDLQKDLKFQFNDQKLLKNAFVHRSYLNEHKDYKGPSNERLEFFGDSIISLIVSRFLYEKQAKIFEIRVRSKKKLQGKGIAKTKKEVGKITKKVP